MLLYLKNLSSDDLYKTIENLILDKKLLQKSKDLIIKILFLIINIFLILLMKLEILYVAKRIF